MKLKLLWIALAIAASAQAATSDPGASQLPDLKPQPHQAQAAHLAAALLARNHYKPIPLDDRLSEKIFERYLKSLDAEKLFFVQADIDRWAPYRTKLDDAIRGDGLEAPFEIFNVYVRRVAERFGYARSLLAQGFDFSAREQYRYGRDKEAWARSDDEIRELWRKRVKNDWLRLKLAGKDDKSIAETLDRRYEQSIKRIARVRVDDAFQSFMNAYTTSIEPHTNYLAPRTAEDFDISMRLSLVGIGAVLTEKDDYVTIRELVAGGPAMLSGELNVGDRIVGVAQGHDGAPVDILGWRVDDAVGLIRGSADSTVRLEILPAEAGPDGPTRQVALVRKKISLEAQAASKSIQVVSDGELTRRVGIIALPAFYQDFEARQKGDPDFRSATRDVSRLLAELKKQKVDSVLIDLRNNGGGSLTEAVDLTGLFIDKGPVVQQRDAQGQLTVASDSRAGVAWDGPLGVLINGRSASASEIFAAAIQDYGRGIVIGEPSFGKGTVQSLVDLDQIVRSEQKQYGELKMTIAQFFRIDGGTTQLRGVTPDIGFPVAIDDEEMGESSFDNALPWTRVKPANYTPVADLHALRPVLLRRHEARVRNDREFQNLIEDIAEFKAQRKKSQLSLNEAERRQERDAREARLAAREKARAAASGAAARPRDLRDDGLLAGERNIAQEVAAEKARKEDRDVLLDAAVRILGDAAGLIRTTNQRVANRSRPAAPLVPPAKPAADEVRSLR